MEFRAFARSYFNLALHELCSAELPSISYHWYPDKSMLSAHQKATGHQASLAAWSTAPSLAAGKHTDPSTAKDAIHQGFLHSPQLCDQIGLTAYDKCHTGSCFYLLPEGESGGKLDRWWQPGWSKNFKNHSPIIPSTTFQIPIVSACMSLTLSSANSK